MWGCGLHSSVSKQAPMAGSCEDGNEHSEFRKGGDSPDFLNDYQFLKDSAHKVNFAFFSFKIISSIIILLFGYLPVSSRILFAPFPWLALPCRSIYPYTTVPLICSSDWGSKGRNIWRWFRRFVFLTNREFLQQLSTMSFINVWKNSPKEYPRYGTVSVYWLSRTCGHESLLKGLEQKAKGLAVFVSRKSDDTPLAYCCNATRVIKAVWHTRTVQRGCVQNWHRCVSWNAHHEKYRKSKYAKSEMRVKTKARVRKILKSFMQPYPYCRWLICHQEYENWRKYRKAERKASKEWDKETRKEKNGRKQWRGKRTERAIEKDA